MKRPVKMCPVNKARCPNPTCNRAQENPYDPSRNFRGRGVTQCPLCGTEYFFHAADGCVYMAGLWPDEARRIDIDAPLPEIWRQLGVMAVA